MVEHNGKHRIVFNCSFEYQGQSLNDYLLPGPTLGPTLLGVLLRFRQHSIAISSDIKGMFHQVRLLSEDKPLLRFLWRDVKIMQPPDVFEWQVLPFGTVCSPCCAVYALQRHTKENTTPDEEARRVVENNFYVDNCLYSLSSTEKAKELVDRLQSLLLSGGFELRQWASNVPEVIANLPEEARSGSNEQWLAQNNLEQQEMALGLRWDCEKDELGYRYRAVPEKRPTMRYIYKVLAKQYDPLGFITPFTTRAKIIVRHLWDKHREWDDPHLPEDLIKAWYKWEGELEHLPRITGAVAYLRTEKADRNVESAFVMARSRVAPKRQQSIPRLELCAALTGVLYQGEENQQNCSLIVGQISKEVNENYMKPFRRCVLQFKTTSPNNR
ncbi:uncharacterized protein LOC122827949 [Gambusia affinis]|uniref:uncharacterized protein LOC122827949 n=1 Tax=Gambusia affinis TaxID=33528 RepID=UPI001CDC58FA|nr:uncharacterized protein LOC122827949 [Gambusia affinis]